MDATGLGPHKKSRRHAHREDGLVKSLSPVLREPGPAHTLIFNFWPPEACGNKWLRCFGTTVLTNQCVLCAQDWCRYLLRQVYAAHPAGSRSVPCPLEPPPSSAGRPHRMGSAPCAPPSRPRPGPHPGPVQGSIQALVQAPSRPPFRPHPGLCPGPFQAPVQAPIQIPSRPHPDPRPGPRPCPLLGAASVSAVLIDTIQGRERGPEHRCHLIHVVWMEN